MFDYAPLGAGGQDDTRTEYPLRVELFDSAVQIVHT
jgi:hypothetical protein